MKSFYQFIENKENSTPIIDIFGEIAWYDDNDEKSFKRKIENIKQDFDVNINTNGGSHFIAVTINNLIERHPNKVTTRIMGLAASAGATIFAAGDIREFPSNANAMIHKPMYNFLVEQNADQLRTKATSLDKIQKAIENCFTPIFNDGIDVNSMLNKETWFTADDAIENGFATKITGKIKIKNCFDMSKFNYTTPQNILNKFDINHKSISTKIKEKFFNKDNNKEIDEMKAEELQVIIDEMGEKVNSLEKSHTENTKNLTTAINQLKEYENTIETQKKDIQELINTNAINTVDARKAEFTNYCKSLADCVPPSEVGTHVDVMESMYSADSASFTDTEKKTPKLDSYKNILKGRKKYIDLSGDHLASIENAVSDTDDEKERNKTVKKMVTDKMKQGIKTDYAAELIEYYKLKA